MRANARMLRPALAAAAAAVVWLTSGELEWPARAFVTFLLAVLPPLAIADVPLDEIEPETLPRLLVYLSSAAALLVLTVLAVAAAGGSGLVEAMGLVPIEPLALLAWTGGTILGLLAIAAIALRLGVRESPLLLHLLPRTGRERAAFVLLAVAAGVGEEVVFRGFLVPALWAATGSLPFAAVFAAAVFGILHAYQDRGGAARAGAMGLLLTTPFLATGSLYPSILAHIAYDVVAGVWLGPWIARRR